MVSPAIKDGTWSWCHMVSLGKRHNLSLYCRRRKKQTKLCIAEFFCVKCVLRGSECATNTTRQTVKLNKLNNYLARASTSSISIFKRVFYLRTKIMTWAQNNFKSKTPAFEHTCTLTYMNTSETTEHLQTVGVWPGPAEDPEQRLMHSMCLM